MSALRKIKWVTNNEIAFQQVGQDGVEEIFYSARRAEEKGRIRLGVLQINNGVLGSYSLKDILIGLGFRKVGVVGISSLQPEKKFVQCPYCKSLQSLREEWQQCESCRKKFYLFDDKW